MLSTSEVGRRTTLVAPLWKSEGNDSSLLAIPRAVASNQLNSEIGAVDPKPERTPENSIRDHGVTNDAAKGIPPPNDVVLQQLDRILRSKTFVQSEKLCRFLRFVVEHVIIGNPNCLKEYLVGVEVYDRKPPYDPSQDSIVRTEARRLRNKLKEYYGGEGKEDPVYIYLRPGSYIPAFQSRDDLAGEPALAESQAELPPSSSSVLAAVMPFMDISGNPESARFARGIPDELAYLLMRNESCTVISPLLTAGSPAVGFDVAATMKRLGAQIAFEGSARVEGTILRVTARIVDATGVQVWVERIDVEIGKKTPFAIEEDIAKALLVGFDEVKATRLALAEGPLA